MEFLKSRHERVNVSEVERWASLIGGGTLVAFGLTRKNAPGLGLAALGGGLIFRGATGHCNMYESMGVNTASHGSERGTGTGASIRYELGIRVDRSITINRPQQEVFRFWRNLENLPKFMDHLESVKVIDNKRSRWVAKAPIGMTVDWDAEIINEIEDQLIGWRSLEGADVDNAGSVRFGPAAGGNGTEVKVSLQYNPPAGSLGAVVARLFGEDPKRTIQADLKRLKELLETGVLSTKLTSRQEANRRTDADRKMWDRDAVQSSSEESFPASDPPSWTPEKL